MSHRVPDSEHDALRDRLDLRRTLVFIRLRLRQGGRRVRATTVPILIASGAALAAWLFSHEVLGHATPVFAAISAWICLGFTFNREPRKVLELGFGATIGVAIGEVALLVGGPNGPTLAIALAVGALTGRLLDRGDFFTMQAGVNAMVVVGMGDLLGAAGGGARLLDAMTGGFIALLVSILLPGNLMARPRHIIAGVLTELGLALSMLASGARNADAEAIHDAHAQHVGVADILEDARVALDSSTTIVRLNPTLRHHRPQATELNRVLALITRLDQVVSMLIRQSRGVVDEAGARPEAAELMDRAAGVLNALAGSVDTWRNPAAARVEAILLARACGPSVYAERDWRMFALVSIMRALAVDLLQLTGLSRAEARGYLPETGTDDEPETLTPEDAASELWGE